MARRATQRRSAAGATTAPGGLDCALVKTVDFFRDVTAKYAKLLRDIPNPQGPGDPDPGGDVRGLLGLDPALVERDPVLRVL